ncbi:hypothetical protein [Sulfitobacter sp. SK012]|uniref:hypothetical protein n=1 Tax=Sulfitobacter sp. SK012 TaxID=1389005 RepID=UPI0013B3DE00|nr:hypothetical protein [Sulfitobacter sp. SK012]
MKHAAILLFALTLGACVETANETEGTFAYRGDTYRSVTREFVRDNGTTYSRRYIYVGTRPVSCSATDDQSCIGAIRDNDNFFDGSLR